VPLHAQAVGGLVALHVTVKFSVVFAAWLFDPGEIEQPLGAPGPPPPPLQSIVTLPLASGPVTVGVVQLESLMVIDAACTGAP